MPTIIRTLYVWHHILPDIYNTVDRLVFDHKTSTYHVKILNKVI